MPPGTIRMSADEKRVKILEIFHETKDFFQLKEIEKLASKKGVVEKTVKDIVQTLVADGLVQSDKIGSSNFFWAFPSARGATLRNQLSKVTEENETLVKRITEMEEAIAHERTSRVDSPERQTALAEFQALQAELAKLKNELSAYGQCDPVHLAQKQRANFLAKEAAIRWTDNVVLARDYFSRLLSLEAGDINQHFDIKTGFEDLE
ncbi:meiotic nuclear division protein 1 [Serendipita vermifera]|nr:meiotic nuclear division protein 1 [Serendipita vermifera]